jgi:hypothetical protein
MERAVQDRLGELGEELVSIRYLRQVMENRERQILKEQTVLVGALPKVVAPEPDVQQEFALKFLVMASENPKLEILNKAIDFVYMTRAHKTNWRSEHGECVDAFVARLLQPFKVA